ncbi:MAG: EFR1 family ferrodoxin [Clostridia bacterium]|nr:EFR1 family ferrodoxin [Clostridia bacterium]
MNAGVFCFSGTGNTWWVSNQLAAALGRRGCPAEVYSIEKLDANDAQIIIQKSDILIFSYPVYGSFMPWPMKGFIDGLLQADEEKDIAVICTQMMFSGDGAWFYHRAFEEKGYKVKWTFHFNMPNNISIGIFPFPYTVDENKINRILKKCAGKVEKAAESISSGIGSLKGAGPASRLMGLMQRPAYVKLVRRPFNSPYSVDIEKCNLCRKCIMMCPENNIVLENGRISFGENCTLCLRCYNYCPQTAISAYGKAHDPKKPPYRGPEGFDPVKIASAKILSDFNE